MTIHVSKDAEHAINVAVQSGQFASAGEMVDRLVREYAQRTGQPSPSSPASQPGEPNLGSIGAMREDADFLDQIVADAMKARQEQPWRLPAGE